MRTISKFSIPLIILVVTWCSSNINWGGNNSDSILKTDAKGYYAYLPAVFVYHDLHFNFHDTIEKKYYSADTYYDYRTAHNSQTIDKYFSGTALAELPFFLMAHVATHFSNYPLDGYSKLYQVFINIGAIFYLFLGLVYIRNLLRSFQVSDNLIAFLLLLLVFGTNLFYYTVVEPGMSHIYSFAFVSIFVYYARKYFITYQLKNIFYCALALGIIVLIRPVNGIVIFSIPFIAGSGLKLKEGLIVLLKNKIQLLLSSLIVVALIAIQPIFYRIQTGDLFIYSYGEEGFHFLRPHMIDFLFSYRKGVFVYAPLLIFSLAGFIYLWKHDRFRFYSLLTFSLGLIYVLSSWWCWWYGGSFGSRVMIDYYVFAGMLLAFAFKLFERRILKIVFTVCLILPTLLCVAQTFQYRYFIIRWDNMTQEKYWDVFLNFDKVTKN